MTSHRLVSIAIVLGCFTLAGFIVAGEPSGQSRARSFKPVFEPAPCQLEASAEVLAQVRCGYVRVPENAERPEGRQLRIAVAVVKSLSATAQPDPIAYLTGGPTYGAIATATVANAGPRYAALRAERDIVIHDYRGTGYSEPGFCPELDDELMQLYSSPDSLPERRAKSRAALTGCVERLRNQGVDLSQYSATTFTTDFEYVRQALGYQRWNLRAGSFGTVVAREAMRRNPEAIRSVVLDSPPVTGQPTEYLTDVLDRLLARCAADAECSTAYPDIRQSFWRAMDALGRQPIEMRPPGWQGPAPSLDQQRFVELIFNVMYERPLLPLVPMLVHEASTGTGGLIGAIGARLINARDSRGGRPALLATVQCTSDALTLGSRANEQEDVQKRVRQEVQELFTGVPSKCEALRNFLPAPTQLQPVTSNIPTLIFTGEFDPVAPRSGGPLVARTLSQSQLVEIPAGGHTDSRLHECTRGLAASFIANPQRKVDTSCLTNLPPLRFATDLKSALEALGAK